VLAFVEDRVAAPAALTPSMRVRRAAGVGAVVLTLTAGTGLWMGRGSKSPVPGSATQSIAILPLVDLSAQHDQQYFADGLTEDLINALANNPGLRVVGRTSAFQFRNSQEDPREIGRKLNVVTSSKAASANLRTGSGSRRGW